MMLKATTFYSRGGTTGAAMCRSGNRTTSTTCVCSWTRSTISRGQTVTADKFTRSSACKASCMVAHNIRLSYLFERGWSLCNCHFSLRSCVSLCLRAWCFPSHRLNRLWHYADKAACRVMEIGRHSTGRRVSLWAHVNIVYRIVL